MGLLFLGATVGPWLKLGPKIVVITQAPLSQCDCHRSVTWKRRVETLRRAYKRTMGMCYYSGASLVKCAEPAEALESVSSRGPIWHALYMCINIYTGSLYVDICTHILYTYMCTIYVYICLHRATLYIYLYTYTTRAKSDLEN